MLFLYVNKLGFSENDFWDADLSKVIQLLDVYLKMQEQQSKAIEKASKGKSNNSVKSENNSNTEVLYSAEYLKENK